eukprot:GHVU01060676.1.p1 GENE.GHVU01060676.1~~GHVU01060676.1.p1  ORF type:complete len:127 (-),score=8.90 GHVU01060676.1:167-547(-)
MFELCSSVEKMIELPVEIRNRWLVPQLKQRLPILLTGRTASFGIAGCRIVSVRNSVRELPMFVHLSRGNGTNRSGDVFQVDLGNIGLAGEKVVMNTPSSGMIPNVIKLASALFVFKKHFVSEQTSG